MSCSGNYRNHGSGDRRTTETIVPATDLSCEFILAKLMLQMQPLSGNQRSDLLASLVNMSLVLRLLGHMRLSRSSSNVPRLPSFLELLQNLHILLTFGHLQNPLCLTRKATTEPSRVVRTCTAFDLEICLAPQGCALFRHLNF